MKFYTRVKHPLSLNVTPLIDIVFLLLIFFVTSTTLTEYHVLNITLPSVLHAADESPAPVLHITVSATGEYSVNHERLSNNALPTLTRVLGAAMPFNPDTVVLIAADANAPYQDVARAMDAASQLGYSHIQLQGQSKQ